MAGGRPSKPLSLVKGHRTKAEIEVRQKAENKLLTGNALKEWLEIKADPIAHKEFARIKKLLKAINHDDDLYGFVINTHCKLKSEIVELVETRDRFGQTMDRLDNEHIENNMDFGEYMKLKINVQGQILKCDAARMQTRKLMLDISKENIMAIQAARRSTPIQDRPAAARAQPARGTTDRPEAGATRWPR